MRETIERLRGLQEIDRELYRVRSELRRLPAERDRRSAGLEGRRAEIADLDRRLQELRTRIKEIEDLTTSQRQRMRKLEGEAASSRGDTALLVAFQHEIRTLRRDIGQAEEEGLGLVEEADALQARRDELAGELGTEQTTFEEYSENVEAELDGARGREAKLEAERRERLGSGIGADVLDQYEKLLDAREGQALAELESRVCQGCYTSVPNNVYVRLARAIELVTCPSCGRILYLPT